MAVQDLVVDTNVLVHASNGELYEQENSINLISYLLGSTELLCLDPDFTGDQATNSSYIGYEYLKHLSIGMLGYAFLSAMATSKRIKHVNPKVSKAANKAILQCMANNHDRVFIKVAINSNEKILVTHDFTDFSKSKRMHLKRTFKVLALTAEQFLAL